MNQDQITQLFDSHASQYDQQWSKLAPINQCLYFLMHSAIQDLPSQRQVLCVGAGTGKEALYLAQHFPSWQFTLVDPSIEMLKHCEQTLESNGHLQRCRLVHGYLEDLAIESPHYELATCFNVSHFILDKERRCSFFQQIYKRLAPRGRLISSDLCFDTDDKRYPQLLEMWLKVIGQADLNLDDIKKMRETYQRDVAILAPNELSALVTKAGFNSCIAFFQAGLISAFLCEKHLLTDD